MPMLANRRYSYLMMCLKSTYHAYSHGIYKRLEGSLHHGAGLEYLSNLAGLRVVMLAVTLCQADI